MKKNSGEINFLLSNSIVNRTYLYNLKNICNFCCEFKNQNTMSSIITGLFKSQSQSTKISQDLEDAGVPENNFIVYLHDKPISKEVKTSLWQSFFGDTTVLEDESLVVSVKVKDAETKEKVSNIFDENDCIHQNYIENIKFKEAQSLQFLKKIVALRAKALIYSSPEIKHHGQNGGINSEVFFGKN